MEAYGFMKTVEKFCERELICIIKIVSDNKKRVLLILLKNTIVILNLI